MLAVAELFERDLRLKNGCLWPESKLCKPYVSLHRDRNSATASKAGQLQKTKGYATGIWWRNLVFIRQSAESAAQKFRRIEIL